MKKLSVVVPVFNEESLITELIKRLKVSLEIITNDFEIIIVDDGSLDETWKRIDNEVEVDGRIKGVKFSRNFGHHFAITAGIHQSNGEWVVVMDGDLQDRPEVIPQLYSKAQEGYDVVFVSRMNRPETLLYKGTQRFFYFLLRNLSGIKFNAKQANFSIISRKVVESFKHFHEHARFYGSTIMWLGFNRTEIFATHGMRFSGKTSYTLKKRFKLAFDIIISFSERPLKFAIALGILMSALSIILSLFIVYKSLVFGYSVAGWASIVAAIFFAAGVVLIVNGVLGIYIGEVFKQVKNRPLYVIDKISKNSSSG